MKFLYSAVLLALVLWAAESFHGAPQGQPPASAPAPAADNVENGKRIFTKYGCYECHGRQNQGGWREGPRIGPLPYPSFSSYVRKPSGNMPPYTEKVVSNQELMDIYAFLQSLPKPPALQTIPLLLND